MPKLESQSLELLSEKIEEFDQRLTAVESSRLTPSQAVPQGPSVQDNIGKRIDRIVGQFLAPLARAANQTGLSQPDKDALDHLKNL